MYLLPTLVGALPFPAQAVTKDPDYTGIFKHETYGPPESLPGDKGLVLTSPVRKHGISHIFDQPITTKGTGLVIQFELLLKNSLECGGAYLKLLAADEGLSPDTFNGDTPYTIMFGPDRCGSNHKLHFILRHKSPTDGTWKECHMTSPFIPPVQDRKPHLYTAILSPDNKVRILVDGEEKKTADLLSETDFREAINPPKEVDDPEDTKPADWVDAPKMVDPEAVKPDDWDNDAPVRISDPKAVKPAAWEDDEPLQVPDATASAPADWDEDEDGEWEPPMVPNPKCKAAGCGEWKPPVIPNPAYKGTWKAPEIDNPGYKGPWKARQIANPNYYYDDEPHNVAPIGGIGIELWTMQDGILFDNILIATDPAVAAAAAAQTFDLRLAAAKEAERLADKDNGVLGALRSRAQEAIDFAQANTLPVLVAVLVGLVSFGLLCCRSKPARGLRREQAEAEAEPAPSRSSKARGNAEAEEKAEEEEEMAEEEVDEDEDEGEEEEGDEEEEEEGGDEEEEEEEEPTKRAASRDTR